METGIKVPIRERINLRILVFAAVVLVPIAWVVYIFIHENMTGGIEQHGDLVKVDLKAMSSFPFDQADGTASDVPQKFRDLNGKRVLMYGEIWSPLSSGPRLTGFQLCYSIAKCCFNGPPQVQHFVQCKPVDGANLSYYQGLVRVVGTLRVNVEKTNGRIVSVYQLAAESIEPQ